MNESRPREAAALALDYVSPLPPVRSGIADYSLDLIPHLATRCDLRLIRLPGQSVTAEVEATFDPQPMESLGEGGRLPLYQMGNNHYHLEVYRAALRVPGVLTLHDLVLHHFLLDRTLGRGDFEPYRGQLEADHGWVGAAAAMPRRWGGYGNAAHFFLPARHSLLRCQRGVLVHSRWAEEQLREEDPELRVRAVPMGVPLPEPLEAAQGRDFRRRHQVPEDAFVIGSFGFQTPIKRTESAIRALARPGLEHTHLLVVGEVAPILDLDREVREAGVGDRVHLTGFLPFGELSAAFAAVDICFNLRYPSAGETSASLLRVLAAGRPAVVSEYAQFVDLPDDVVLKVPVDDDEVAALAEVLRRAAESPELLREMAVEARRHVAREHDPERAATAVVDACMEWRDQPSLPPASVDPPPPTSLTWRRLRGEVQVSGAELPWPEGERRRLQVWLRNTGFASWLAGDRGVGGVVVQVNLVSSRGDLMKNRPWFGLPRDLAPGEACTFTLEVRRPLGPATLRIQPHLIGASGLTKNVGGPLWEAEI